MHAPRLVFFTSILLISACARTETVLERLHSESGGTLPFKGYTPDFSFQKESFPFKGDEGEREFWVIRDHGRAIAVIDRGMMQLDMITFRPGTAPEDPPFGHHYSWGSLLGTRITVGPWTTGMGPTGTTTLDLSGGGSTVSLITTQVEGPRKQTRYDMTLRVDERFGYAWDMTTVHESGQVPVIEKKKKDRIIRKIQHPEFFNWQVRVTDWTTRHGNPRWPADWSHEYTVFYSESGTLVGFDLNPEANDHSRYGRTEVAEGGFVAMLPGPDGWGVALTHVAKHGASHPNATCNMWGDSHNYLAYPDAPDADGMYRIRGEWRFHAIPPETVDTILAGTEIDPLGRNP